MMPRVSKRIVVSGKVQGVFYRASTVEKAIQLQLVGWVTNLPTGEVAIFVAGLEDALSLFVDWCHQGSEYSRVDKVLVADSDEAAPKDFKIIY